ncbi:YqzG/YhdC family protein [Robertmurraya korlensis]|uniref:DUF3889 domain-containing protein n=1 Tax=Robertmurraya korlensis TaxID=519977 RepID=UPI002041D351|nr:DUF3889 domain-containing protein [Robertmurraya korlensis]MCM3600028.1 YqzG/YhdC family protein [Robertmurraya korlensis]
MKIILSVHLLFGLFLFGDFSIINTSQETHAEQQQGPPYAKWGQIAMKKTKEKYPQANIIDYLHIGREKGTKYSTEKFKLWLKTDSKEFGVFVDITFDNKTEQIKDIKYRETTRQ